MKRFVKNFMCAAIVGTLLSFCLAGCGKSGSPKAGLDSCTANLKLIGLALKGYASDHSDKFPAPNGGEGLKVLLQGKYLEDPGVLHCPACKEKGSDSYFYVGGLSEDVEPETPLVICRNHGKNVMNVVYVHGGVVQVPGNKISSLFSKPEIQKGIPKESWTYIERICASDPK